MRHILAAACTEPDLVFDAAFIVAEQFDSHVVGLGGAWPRQFIRTWNETAGAIAVEGALLFEQEEEERNRQARKSFLSIASERGISLHSKPNQIGPSAEWRFVCAPGEISVASFGRAFDLVVVEQPTSAGSFAQARLDGAILDSGRPVLMAPRHPRSTIGKRVVIVWRGSVACSRSVAMAKPFIGKAEKIEIVAARADALGPCVELERSLAAHAASVTVRYLPSRMELDGKAVVAEASAFDADLIVAGAYSRGRYRELLGQSWTRTLIKAAETPVLFAH